jgi:hypothetical protein
VVDECGGGAQLQKLVWFCLFYLRPRNRHPSPGRGISDLVAFLCSAGDNPVATILFGFIQRLVSLFHRLIKALFSSALGDANIGDDIAM